MICCCWLAIEDVEQRREAISLLNEVVEVYNDAGLLMEEALALLELADGYRKSKLHK